MARQKRLKIQGEESYYHIISRTVGQEFFLGDEEKENLFNIIKYYSGMYFVKVIGYCIMSSHVHLLIKSEPEFKYTDVQLFARIEKYVLKGKKLPKHINMDSYLNKYRKKFENISEYARSVKQTFARWYNKINNRTGYFWGDRFKSVLFEPGNSLITCLAYIELNPIRAKMVKLPEEYRWSSIHYRVVRGNRDHFLSFDGIFDNCDEISKKEQLATYRYFVYKAGNVTRITLKDIEEGRWDDDRPRIDDIVYNEELQRNFQLPAGDLILRKVRHFSDGLVIGTKLFIKKAYSQFGGNVILKKDRKAHQTGINSSLYSLKRLVC